MNEALKTYLDKFEKETINEIHSGLVKIKQDFINHMLQHVDSGICGNVQWNDYALCYILYVIISYWPEYTGDPAFPVPSFEEGMSPRDKSWKTKDKWNQSTEYGKARVRLLDWCIATLEEYLKGNRK